MTNAKRWGTSNHKHTFKATVTISSDKFAAWERLCTRKSKYLVCSYEGKFIMCATLKTANKQYKQILDCGVEQIVYHKQTFTQGTLHWENKLAARKSCVSLYALGLPWIKLCRTELNRILHLIYMANTTRCMKCGTTMNILKGHRLFTV